MEGRREKGREGKRETEKCNDVATGKFQRRIFISYFSWLQKEQLENKIIDFLLLLLDHESHSRCSIKNLLGLGKNLEKAMAAHSSTLAWEIPWMEDCGGLQSMGLGRVGSLFTFMHWRRKLQPTPVFLPGESQGQGSLVGCRL